MSIPKYTGKISAEKLRSMPKQAFEGKVEINEKCQYYTKKDGLEYDFLWYPNPGYKKLFIFFSGDILREKNAPPVYQRWSWATHFPGNCLFFSDPSLKLSNKLGLSWYSGSEDADPMPNIACIVNKICSYLEIDEKDIVTYGSSGGGFAAIRFLLFSNCSTAVAINPQTRIKKYYRSKVKEYLQELYPSYSIEDALKAYETRMDLLKSYHFLKNKKIIYVQNTVDNFHMKNHAEPFFKMFGSNSDHLNKMFFEELGGHGKAENQEVFDKILAMIS